MGIGMLEKPETKIEFSAYRCKTSCKIGRDALDGEIPLPNGISASEYALYNLLHAVEELSVMLMEIKSSK